LIKRPFINCLCDQTIFDLLPLKTFDTNRFTGQMLFCKTSYFFSSLTTGDYILDFDCMDIIEGLDEVQIDGNRVAVMGLNFKTNIREVIVFSILSGERLFEWRKETGIKFLQFSLQNNRLIVAEGPKVWSALFG
jgi:hypothetical protein